LGNWESILNQGALYSIIIQLALGGVFSVIKDLLFSEDNLRNHIKLSKNILIQKISNTHKKIYRSLFNSDGSLQFKVEENDDLIGQYTEENFRASYIYFDLLSLKRKVSNGYSFLLVTALLGIPLLIFRLLFPQFSGYIFIIAVLIIFLQIADILTIKENGRKIKDYDEEL
jgi:hypothetical protein